MAATRFASGVRSAAADYDSCERRCASCEIGASNAKDPEGVTFIYRDPLKNIPKEIAAGAAECVQRALNQRNRASKWKRFGFSTSEDAVTWVVFVHLLRSGQLGSALSACGLLSSAAADRCSLLLWGNAVDGAAGGPAIRDRLTEISFQAGEDPQSMSEPDVIVDAGPAGLVFIEVKFRSGNDNAPADYPGWMRYLREDGPFGDAALARASGCYELARNWYFMSALANGRPATLVNLGQGKLFSGIEGQRLARFEQSLNGGTSQRFARLTWSQFLSGLNRAPQWSRNFCTNRGLGSRRELAT